jgi:site-specific recombinase XerD
LLEHIVAERNLAINTQHSYRDAICQLLPFCSTQCKKPVDALKVEDLSQDRIKAFLSHVEINRQCTVRSRNQRLAAIRALARFIGDRSPEHIQWCANLRAIPFKRTDTNPVTYLEKSEIDALLAAPNRATPQGQRDYALLLFLYNSGARASEAMTVQVEDLQQGSNGTGIVRLNGKGRKIRFCPLWKRTMSELAPLIGNRPVNTPLFVNRYQRPLTRFGIHSVVERHTALAAQQVPALKKKRVSPHIIRHTTATHLLRAGVDINTIRSWLGHVSVDTTNIYAEADMETKARALAACDPGTGSKRTSRWRDDPKLMEFLRSL